jgi:hypothetical protein
MGRSLGFQGISVHKDRLATSALISVLALEFVDRGQQSVPFETISEQAVALVDAVPASEVTAIIDALLQRLMMTQARVFRCQEKSLVLTEDAIRHPSTVQDALRGFAGNLDSRRLPAERGLTAERTESASGSEQPEALNDFFQGFDQEIMRARLGDKGKSEP